MSASAYGDIFLAPESIVVVPGFPVIEPFPEAAARDGECGPHGPGAEIASGLSGS